MSARLDPAVLADLAPVLRRAVSLERGGVARVVVRDGTATVLVRLPFGVLVSRSVAAPGDARVDTTLRSGELLDWLDGAGGAPAARDSEWRSGLPPVRGWTRLDSVPDDVIRPLIRSGASALKQAADREGVPGAQPRAEVSDALLDSVVLTVSDDTGRRAEVVLRTVSALTRMGFLPSGGYANVELAGRWIRVVAEHGTVYQERAGVGLSVSPR